MAYTSLSESEPGGAAGRTRAQRGRAAAARAGPRLTSGTGNPTPGAAHPADVGRPFRRRGRSAAGPLPVPGPLFGFRAGRRWGALRAPRQRQRRAAPRRAGPQRAVPALSSSTRRPLQAAPRPRAAPNGVVRCRSRRGERCGPRGVWNRARKTQQEKKNKMRVLSFAELVIKLKASALNMRHAVTGEPGSAPRYPPALCGMLRSGGIFGQGVQAAATSLSCSAREAQGGKQRGARGCGAGGCSAQDGRPHNAAPAGARSRLGDSRPSARAQQVGCFTECLSVLSGKPSGTPTAAHRAEAQLCSGSTCPAAAGCGSLTLQVHTESGDAF